MIYATHNDHNGPPKVLLPDKPSTSQKNEDGDGHGGNGQGKLDLSLSDDDHKLDGESEEEEKVELQEGDIDLILKIASLHPQIGRDALVDCPGKLVVELPGAACHQECSQCQNARDGNQKGFCITPDLFVDEVVFGQFKDGLFDLLHLHCAIDEEANIVHDQANHLDGVFHAQRIPNEDELVDEAENV